MMFGFCSHPVNSARRKLSGINISAVRFLRTVDGCEPFSVSVIVVMLYGMILNSLVLVLADVGLWMAFLSFGRNSLYLALSVGKSDVLRIHSANSFFLNWLSISVIFSMDPFKLCWNSSMYASLPMSFLIFSIRVVFDSTNVSNRTGNVALPNRTGVRALLHNRHNPVYDVRKYLPLSGTKMPATKNNDSSKQAISDGPKKEQLRMATRNMMIGRRCRRYPVRYKIVFYLML